MLDASIRVRCDRCGAMHPDGSLWRRFWRADDGPAPDRPETGWRRVGRWTLEGWIPRDLCPRCIVDMKE